MATYPRTGIQRILAGSVDPVLRVTFLDQDGEPVGSAPSGVTCTITRADGTVIATGRTTTASGADLTCALTTAEAASLDVLSAVWTDDGAVRARSYHRLVGGFLFTIAELDALGGVSTFTAVQKRAARDAVTDMIERETGVCWNTTYDRDEFEGHDRTVLVAKRRPIQTVREFTIENVQVATTYNVNAAAGLVTPTVHGSLSMCGWVVFGYEHGFNAPPHDLSEAAAHATKLRLLGRTSGIGERVRSISDEQGTRTFSFAGPGHPTGVDEIDAVITAHDMRDPAVF